LYLAVGVLSASIALETQVFAIESSLCESTVLKAMSAACLNAHDATVIFIGSRLDFIVGQSHDPHPFLFAKEAVIVSWRTPVKYDE
jgi:hypothetical protein